MVQLFCAQAEYFLLEFFFNPRKHPVAHDVIIGIHSRSCLDLVYGFALEVNVLQAQRSDLLAAGCNLFCRIVKTGEVSLRKWICQGNDVVARSAADLENAC